MAVIIDLESHPHPFVSVADLAAYWSVHPRTIYRDIARGLLVVYYLPSGTIRVPIDAATSYGKPNTETENCQ